MHQGVKDIGIGIGLGIVYNSLTRVDKVMSDKERDSVGTLGIYLFLRVDTSIHECLYDPTCILYQILMIQQYVVLQCPK